MAPILGDSLGYCKVEMDKNAQTGFAVASHANRKGCAVKFDNVVFIGSEPPAKPKDEIVVVKPPADASVFDDFTNPDQFKKKKNDMGGGYWGDGQQTCDGHEVILKGVSWWDCTFSPGETDVDLCDYINLVYIIKGAPGATMNVTMWDADGAKSMQNIPITTTFQEVKLPLSKFKFNMASARKFKHAGFNGEITIAGIWFERDPKVPPATPKPKINTDVAVAAEPTPEPLNEARPGVVIFDDFNDVNRYNKDQKNSLDGGYWGDGQVTCDGTQLTLRGVTWWDSTFSRTEHDVDLSAYNYLVYVIKGSSGATMTVSMWDADGAKGVQNVPITTTYQTVKIPLDKFPGFDKTKARKFKHSGFNGTITIDEIRFEK